MTQAFVRKQSLLFHLIGHFNFVYIGYWVSIELLIDFPMQYQHQHHKILYWFSIGSSGKNGNRTVWVEMAILVHKCKLRFHLCVNDFIKIQFQCCLTAHVQINEVIRFLFIRWDWDRYNIATFYKYLHFCH